MQGLRLVMGLMAAMMVAMLLFYQMELLPSVAITFKDGRSVEVDFAHAGRQSTADVSTYGNAMDDDGLPDVRDDEESITLFHSIPGDSGEVLEQVEEEISRLPVPPKEKEEEAKAPQEHAKTERQKAQEKQLQAVIDRLADEEEEWLRLEEEAVRQREAEELEEAEERQRQQDAENDAVAREAAAQAAAAQLAAEEEQWDMQEEAAAAVEEGELVSLNELPATVSLPEVSEMIFDVTMPPTTIHACHENEIVFTARGGDLPAVDLSAGYLYVHMQCTINRTRVALDDELDLLKGIREISRVLPAVPSLSDKRQMIATFFADDPLYACSFTAASSLAQWQVEGTTQQNTIVEPFVFRSGAWCFNCRGVFTLPVALPYHFGLKCDHGEWLWDWDEPLSMVAGETFRMWVSPFTWTEQAWKESGLLEDLLFNVIIKSSMVTQAVEVSGTWDAERHGYAIDITPEDAGVFRLYVALVVVYGGGNVMTDPKPIPMGSHVRHEYSECDYIRSEVHGSNLSFQVARREDQAENVVLVPAESAHYCDTLDAPGRWVRTLPASDPCVPPYCTGNRTEVMVSSMSWQGRIYDDLWVPYDCHYHYYGIEDLEYCMAEKNINWIHVMGDSLPREVAGYLLSLAGVADTNKFETADADMFGPGLGRVTFQTWADMLNANRQTTEGPEMYRHRWFLKLMLDHYNLLAPDTSTRIDEFEFRLELDSMTGRPDVFVMNPAMAYTLFQQTEESYSRFLDDFLDLTRDMCTVGINGQEPVRCFWYGNPYVWAAAHDKTAFLTQPRNRRFMAMTLPRVQAAGWTVFDPVPITMSRPEESWDGLHYLRGYMEWNGHVASTNIQVLLNGILGDCKGRPGQ